MEDVERPKKTVAKKKKAPVKVKGEKGVSRAKRQRKGTNEREQFDADHGGRPAASVLVGEGGPRTAQVEQVTLRRSERSPDSIRADIPWLTFHV